MFSSQNSQVSNNVNYIEDVFSTYLYTGNGSTQTITNGIDLAGEGGLVWVKPRSVQFHNLYDTVRGTNSILYSNTTDAAESKSPAPLVSYNTTGFTLDSYTGGNASGTNFASWTFRKQPKFFDIVTYTGNGTAGRTVVHNLGSVPGCIIVKRTDTADAWAVYHRGVNSGTGNGLLVLNTTAAQNVNGKFWWGDNTNFIAPTSTNFTVSTDGQVNASGGTYVAYVFAHNAGGFGLTGTDNVISCGSYNGNSTTNSINLGYEPQWLLIKRTTVAASDWVLLDNMRGLTVGTSDAALCPNNSNAEGATVSVSNAIRPTATGFDLLNSNSALNVSGSSYIYIAIRRPMKVPTLGTSVFSPIAANNAQGTENTTGFPLDMQIMNLRSGYGGNGVVSSRLTGVSSNTTSSGSYLRTPSSSAEATGSDITQYWGNTGFQTSSNWAGAGMIYWSFRRAPGFFDEVCYTGTGVARTVEHNLGVAPELIIVKARNRAEYWICYQAALGNAAYVLLNYDGASSSGTYWNNTSPTSSVFSVSGNSIVGGPYTYVAYLFATCAGVSKVGSYTGTGALQTVACGFTSGARFVLIRRTDATGDWYVWDSARGITSGNDPYLLLNTTAAEVTATNYVDTDTTGFKVTAAAPAGLNASGGTYIFLAIA